MAKEKPLNIQQFFMSRNEVASEHGSKLELQAMSRVRKHMVEEQAKNVLASKKEKTDKKK